MLSYFNLFKDSRIQKLIGVWMLCWLLIAGGTIYILPLFGADQFHNVQITFTYFIVFSLVGALSYDVMKVFSHQKSFKEQLLWIGLITAIQFLICLTVNRFFPLSQLRLNQIISSKFYFPLFTTETLIAKVGDICFQQTFIFGLIKTLKNIKIPDPQIIFLFSVAFFIVHLPLLFSLQLYALLFIIPSSFAGLLFAFALLKNRRGLVLSVLIHELFYVILGLVIRLS